MIDRIIIFICCTMIAAIGIAAWSYVQHPGRFVVSKQAPKIVNYDHSAGELVTFETVPESPKFNGPCPVSQGLVNNIHLRSTLMGFNKGQEPDKRQWHDIVESFDQPRTLDGIKKKLRNFLVTYQKFALASASQVFGETDIQDLSQQMKIAICDEVAIIHHHIKGGINPAIGGDYIKNQKLEISELDRDLFRTIYQSCRMGASNSFRYTPGLLTHITFEPTPEELLYIQKRLDVDPNRPNEVVCTYRKPDQKNG